MISRLLYLVAAVTMAITLPTSAVAKVSLTLKDDTRDIIEVAQFVFGNENNAAGSSGGTFTIKLSSFEVTDGSPFLNREKQISPLNEPIGIVADRVDSDSEANMRLKTAKRRMSQDRVCYIDDPTFKTIASTSVNRPPSTSAVVSDEMLFGRYVFPINGLNVDTISKESITATFHVNTPGMYVFYFYNCRGFHPKGAELAADASTLSERASSSNGVFSTLKRTKMPPISAKFEITMWNIDSDGYTYYLPGNQQSLPFWFSFFTILFFCGGVTWYRLIKRRPEFVVRIHYGLLVLVIVKTLSLAFEAMRYSHFKSTGEESVWTGLYFIALGVKGVLLFSSLLLVGAGWSIVKSSISDTEKTLLKLLIPAQILLNICQVILDETSRGNRSWNYAQDMLLFLDMVCCLAVLVPLFTSMKNLQDIVEKDEKTARVTAQLKMLRSLYFAIVIYLYSSRVLMRLLTSIVPYYVMGWMGPILMETIAGGFYFYCGYMLQPSPGGTFTPLATGTRLEVDQMMHSRREIGTAREIV